VTCLLTPNFPQCSGSVLILGLHYSCSTRFSATPFLTLLHLPALNTKISAQTQHPSVIKLLSQCYLPSKKFNPNARLLSLLHTHTFHWPSPHPLHFPTVYLPSHAIFTTSTNNIAWKVSEQQFFCFPAVNNKCNGSQFTPCFSPSFSVVKNSTLSSLSEFSYK
jgi:hypothetical protein